MAHKHICLHCDAVIAEDDFDCDDDRDHDFELCPSCAAKNMKKLVTTYRLAYPDQEVTLCPDCTDTYSGVTLGPVQWGQHLGYCEECNKWQRGEYGPL